MTDPAIYDIGTMAEREAQDAEEWARGACFRDCASGAHLDLENGVVSVCRGTEYCQGWRAYLHKMEGLHGSRF